jgi:tRNA threonylcarbamoyladenosine modification (KEOPS) complex Cgi121 subunit
MSTRSLTMETLLYLSGRRQVADAIAAAGIRRGTDALAVVVFGDARAVEVIDAMGWSADADVLAAAAKSSSLLGLTQAELSTIPEEHWPDLALERVALLEIEK